MNRLPARFFNSNTHSTAFALCLACLTYAGNVYADPATENSPGKHPVEDFLDLDKVKAMPEVPPDIFGHMEIFKPENLAATSGKLRKFVLRTETNTGSKLVVTVLTYASVPGHPGYYVSHVQGDDGPGIGTSSITTNQLTYLNLAVVASEMDGTFREIPTLKSVVISGYAKEIHLPSDFDKALARGAAWQWDWSQASSMTFIGSATSVKSESKHESYACFSDTPLAASAISAQFTGEMVPVSCERRPEKDKAQPKDGIRISEWVYLKDYGIFLPTKTKLVIPADKEGGEPTIKILTTSSLHDVVLVEN